MLIDNREKALIQLLPEEPVKVLPVGDVWIGLSGEELLPHGLLIERKSTVDFHNSILDKRYREQRSRLLATATEYKAHPVYILEGSLNIPFATLEKPALLKHLTRLALRYHIPFFTTANIRETAELLQILESQWKDDPTTFQQPRELTYVETRGKSRIENSDDPKVFAASVLMCCRGVSAQTANALLAECGGTLAGVWEASVETLAAIQVGKQKFGKVKAERLHSLLHQ